jgi:hypothetical protein
MARTWGATRAKFWDVAGAWPGLPAEINGSEYLETVVDNSVTWTRLISQIGQGAAQFYAVRRLGRLAHARPRLRHRKGDQPHRPAGRDCWPALSSKRLSRRSPAASTS